MYIVCEKIYTKRLGKELEDEINIIDSDNIEELIKQMKEKQKINIARRTIFNAIKENKPIFNKYYIYKIKEEVE